LASPWRLSRKAEVRSLGEETAATMLVSWNRIGCRCHRSYKAFSEVVQLPSDLRAGDIAEITPGAHAASSGCSERVRQIDNHQLPWTGRNDKTLKINAIELRAA
jgi:hypothetical protein